MNRLDCAELEVTLHLVAPEKVLQQTLDDLQTLMRGFSNNTFLPDLKIVYQRKFHSNCQRCNQCYEIVSNAQQAEKRNVDGESPLHMKY